MYMYTIAKTKNIDDLISVDYLKEHLKIPEDYIDQDSQFLRLIHSAIAIAEGTISKDIRRTSNVLTFEDYSGIELDVDEGNLLSVSAVTINGQSITFNAYNYGSYFKVKLSTYVSGDLKIYFSTGYEELPEDMKRAITIKAGDLYTNEASDYNFSSLTNNNVYGRIMSRYIKHY